MALSALQAAKIACERANWKLTNLELQKILYIAHMIYMGDNEGERLIDDTFQAWNYGPVLPDVYHKVKTFGGEPIKNVFHSVPDPGYTDEVQFLQDAVDVLSLKTSGNLVSITHWEEGAWAMNYSPGHKNKPIPDEDIITEVKNRDRAREKRKQD